MEHLRGRVQAMPRLDRLKSRKLWVTVTTAALVAFADQLGLGLSSDTVYALVALAIGYTASQAHIDKVATGTG